MGGKVSWTMLTGDARDVLAGLEDRSVHCCVTSPPYFGLRSYLPNRVRVKVALSDEECRSVQRGLECLGGHLVAECVSYEKSEIPDNLQEYFEPVEIGLEETPQRYIENLVEVFDGVRRVLRDDGTLWIVIGDSYAGSMQGILADGTATAGKIQRTNTGSVGIRAHVPKAHEYGMKPKDLVGIPWMLAFALRDAGWYLRQEIIWAKGISGPIYRGGSCMPEAVKDRCTKSHETVFLLSKSRRYYYDHEAIKEPAQNRGEADSSRVERKRRDVPHEGCHANTANRSGGSSTGLGSLERRNRRSVWHVNPRSCKEAHFATFPQDLVRPMVLAGAPDGGVVLDPFAGSGTTGLVANEHRRSFIGIELNPEYVCNIAGKRLGLPRQVWLFDD